LLPRARTSPVLAKVAEVFGGEARPDEPTVDLKVPPGFGQPALENDS
jgi:hypothetical protein